MPGFSHKTPHERGVGHLDSGGELSPFGGRQSLSPTHDVLNGLEGQYIRVSRRELYPSAAWISPASSPDVGHRLEAAERPVPQRYCPLFHRTRRLCPSVRVHRLRSTIISSLKPADAIGLHA